PGGSVTNRTAGPTFPASTAPVVHSALTELGKHYQWGAVGPNSYDCSGLTQTSYAAAGIRIGRTTYQQATDGIATNWVTQQLQPGDLILTSSGDGQRFGHVGIDLDATHWIVAPSPAPSSRSPPSP